MDEYQLFTSPPKMGQTTQNHELSETIFVTTRIIELRLMDRVLAVSAQTGSESRLENAALYLDSRLQTARQQLPAVSSERIALIVALNLAAELLDIRDKHHRSRPVLDNESARQLQKLAAQMQQTGSILDEALRKLLPTEADELEKPIEKSGLSDKPEKRVRA